MPRNVSCLFNQGDLFQSGRPTHAYVNIGGYIKRKIDNRMAKEISTTMRSRRVIYDDFTGGFYVESRVEALERQCATRSSEIDVLNKSQDAKFEFAQKQVEAARKIFERKTLAEVNHHKQNLREHIAHKHVLGDIARESDNVELDGDSPRSYGFGRSKLQLQPLIEQRIKDCSPSSKRRRAAKRLLQDRKPTEVFDRDRSTSSLLQSVRRKHRHRSRSDAGEHDYTTRQSTAQLVLPPISMSMNHVRASSESAGGTVNQTKLTKQNDLSLPSLFLTQNSHS